MSAHLNSWGTFSFATFSKSTLFIICSLFFHHYCGAISDLFASVFCRALCWHFSSHRAIKWRSKARKLPGYCSGLFSGFRFFLVSSDGGGRRDCSDFVKNWVLLWGCFRRCTLFICFHSFPCIGIINRGL